jgi:hypothetical protein
MAIMILYGLVMGNWSELFYGVDNFFLSILLCISYPVFFLFFIPFAIFRIMVMGPGTPVGLWERVFAGSSGSTENLKCEGGSVGLYIVRYIYIGIPFFIFALIYILLMIALSPLWYYIFSPIGIGMYSVCLAVGLSPDDVRASSINERVERTYRWGMIINVFVLALLGILVSACYIGLVAPHWWAVVLLVFSLLNFICGIWPTIQAIMEGDGLFNDLQGTDAPRP